MVCLIGSNIAGQAGNKNNIVDILSTIQSEHKMKIK